MIADIPSALRAAEFTRLRFLLVFRESCSVDLGTILRLRRDLHQAGRQVLGAGEPFARLFDPPLPVDPVALRRHQRPGPPFALHPPANLPAVFGPGDVLALPAILFGAGSQRLADFIRVLQGLGFTGLHRGEGRFELVAVEAQDAAGRYQPLWETGRRAEQLAAPLLEVRWWLEGAVPPSPVTLEFLTPARLIAGGRPLFRTSFHRLFPFLLRRVTSMLYAHCGIETAADPASLLAAASRVAEAENRLRWQDWRVLEGDTRQQDLGGLVGRLRLEGEALEDILWVLGIASLLNVGRGASFAAGHFALRPGNL